MKCRIIRVKGIESSERYAEECFQQAEKHGLTPKYFNGINGTSYLDHLSALQIKPRYAFKEGRPGVFGCLLSHYYLWQECARMKKPYVILEHDGYMIRSLPSDILDKFDDVLKLDRHDPYDNRYNELIEADDDPVTVQSYHNPLYKEWIINKAGTGNYMRGTYSYIIKPKAAQKLLDWISVNGFVPSDQQIGSNIVDIKATVPTVARLHPAFHGRIVELSLTHNTELLKAKP